MLAELFNIYCLSLLVILILEYCRDSDDISYDIKVNESWKVTPCLACHCNKGLLSCRKDVKVFFPGYRHSYVLLEEFCHQPSCNVSKFIKEKRRDVCEGKNLLALLS